MISIPPKVLARNVLVRHDARFAESDRPLCVAGVTPTNQIEQDLVFFNTSYLFRVASGFSMTNR